MAETTYTISMVDDVSGAAARVAVAMGSVKEATQDYAAALETASAVGIRAARGNVQMARAQLQIERAALGEAKAVLTAAQALDKLAGSERGAADEGKALQGVMAGAVGGAFALLGEKILEVAGNLAGDLVSGLADAGQYLFHVADEAGRAHMALSNMMGSQEAGNAVLKDAIDLAKRFGLSLDTTIERAQQFAGLGFDRNKIKAMFELGVDFRALGRTEDQINRIFADFEHVQASGKLDGRVLRSLAMNGVSLSLVYERIAHNAGLTGTKQEQLARVLEMVRAGAVKAGPALNAIAEAVLIRGHKSEVGQLGEQAADETLGGMAGKLKANLESSIFNAVDAATPALIKGGQAIVKGLSGGTEDSFEKNLTASLEKFGAFLEEIGPKMPAFIDSINKLASALLTLGNIAAKLAGPAFDVGVMGTVRVLKGSVSPEQYDAMGNPVGADLGNGIAQGITDSAPKVGAAAADAAQGAVDASKETLKIHSPSAVMADQGEMLALGLTLGIDEHADTVFSSAAALAQGALDASGAKLGTSSASAEATAVGSAAGAAIGSAAGGSRAVIHVDAPIQVDGSSNPHATAAAIRDLFEAELATVFERHLEGVGA